MVFVDISLTLSLPGATLLLSGSQNKRILGDFMGLCFFGRLRLRQKEGVTRIRLPLIKTSPVSPGDQ